MDIPLRIRIPVCIEQGSVFNFRLEVDGSGRQSKNRYFVVLNHDPKSDAVLILLTSTTQISRKKAFVQNVRISEETIVVVSPHEYTVFACDSAFNCNDVHEVCMSDLIRKVEEGGSDVYPKMPEKIVERLIKGVRASPRIAPAVKRLL